MAYSGEATVSITVTPVNDPPVANPDQPSPDQQRFEVNAGGSVQIPVLANDSDPDGDSLEVVIVTQPTKGSVSVTDGVVTYTADADSDGEDTFVYRAKDGAGALSAPITVTITIFPVLCTDEHGGAAGERRVHR